MWDFLKKAFSDNGTPSSSRLLTAVAMLSVLTGWLHVAFFQHHLPEAGATVAAATLGTAPYGLNSAMNAWKSRNGAAKEPEPNVEQRTAV